MPGTVILIHLNKEVQRRRYSCESEKERTIDSWKRLYGPAFKNCTTKSVKDVAVSVHLDKEEIIIPEKSNFKKGDLPKVHRYWQKSQRRHTNS